MAPSLAGLEVALLLAGVVVATSSSGALVAETRLTRPTRRRRRRSAAVLMGAVGALDLADKIGHRDELLGPGRQVAQADLARRQLVADDHREVGAVLAGRLELSPELAAARSARTASPPRAGPSRS